MENTAVYWYQDQEYLLKKSLLLFCKYISIDQKLQ